VVFSVIVAMVLLLVLEGTVRLGLWLFRPRVTLASILERQRVAALPASRSTGGRIEVIHPYVGYVVDPTVMPGFNRYGFLQVDGPILKRREGLVIVGVTGGSVARDLCQSSSATLRSRLSELSGGKEVAVVCLAQEGFHQPQQVMAWSYFRSLGAEFDYLVNLDGFNEVALYPAESSTDTTWFGYPRAWETRLSDTANPELNRLIGEGVQLRQRRIAWARRFTPWQGLPLLSVHLVWSSVDDAFQDQIANVTFDVARLTKESENLYSHAGPVVRFASPGERTAALVEFWGTSSALLSEMCGGAGTKYLHCLQPNIGVDAQKALTDEEEELLRKESPYRQPAQQGYPQLLKRGQELLDQGIAFHDLTGLFGDVSASVYADNCCHLHQLGNDMLARRLAELLSGL
jgi:hypothetical protein